MQIFYWKDLINNKTMPQCFEKGGGLSIGSFDGLHLGHRLLLSNLCDYCKKNNFLKGVFTFTRPLPSLKHNDQYLGDICTLNQRLHLFETLGLDFVIIADFNENFSQTKGTDFLSSLIKVCNMKFLAEGVDFRCGYKGATDTQAIKYFANANNLQTLFVEPVFYNDGFENERVSSSYIRKMIKDGFLSTVQKLLERPYELDISDFVDSEIELKNIVQVIPRENIYHCNKGEKEVRVEINSEKIIIKDFEKLEGNEKIESLIFN